MESENSQPQESIRIPSPATHNTHPTLLTTVQNRIEQYKMQRSDDHTTDELLQALQHPQWEIRVAVIRTLAARGKFTSPDMLNSALHDEHHLVRAAAVKALETLHMPLPVEQLLLAMQDRDWEVREMAMFVLGEHEENIPPALLHIALQDPNNHVREAAAYALQKRVDSRSEKATTGREHISQRFFTRSRSLYSNIGRTWAILTRQIPTLHKSIWVSPILIIFFWGLLIFSPTFLSRGSTPDMHQASLLLALLTTVSAATATAFLYGGENDIGFELILSTPTSMRIIMMCRFFLVIAYNIAISSCASMIVILAHGGTLWETIQLWLGPMLLVSSLTLALSLSLGSWFSLGMSLLLEASQMCAINLEKHIPAIELAQSHLWQTNPPILLLTLICLVVTILYAPRQPRLANRLH